MNTVVPFMFEDRAVRVADQDGQPWFVLADICAALGIRNPSDAASRLDDTEKARLNLGSGSDATIVSLAGALTLILRCRNAMKPDTLPYRIRKWITADVVPTVMRTGSYGTPAPAIDLLDPRVLQQALLGMATRTIAAEERIAEVEAQTEALQGKAEALDRLTDASGLMCLSDAAKTIGMAPRQFVAWLILRGWIFKRQSGANSAAQGRLNDRTLAHRTFRRPRSDGLMTIEHQVMVTAKGLAKLAEMAADGK